MERIFLSWEHCERTKNLAYYLGAAPIFIEKKWRANVFSLACSYCNCTLRTWLRLGNYKPKIIFSHNLPPFLVLNVYLYSLFTKTPFILDGHSGAFNLKKWRWFLPFYKFIAKRALFCVSTNSDHYQLIKQWGGQSVIISDIPIVVDPKWATTVTSAPTIFVPCSFSHDEPLQEIFDAAALLPNVTFKITGNYRKIQPDLLKKKPNNIIFTDFLDRDAYFSLMAAASAVLVLTTRDNTMQRGAYEALSLSRPVITSNWRLLRDTFAESAIYVDNTAHAIAEGINELFLNYGTLARASLTQKKHRKDFFLQKIQDAETIIASHKL